MADRTLNDLMQSPELTAEIMVMAMEIVDGWYQTGRINWGDVWDRLDGAELSNGDRIDVGGDLLAPELARIKNHVNAERRKE